MENRFRVFNREGQKRVFTADTTSQIAAYLERQDRLYILPELFVDDCLEDIEVDAECFLIYYRENKCEDLQGF